MKVGQKTYNRGLGKGTITKITDEFYEVTYDKIKVEYPHKDISYLIVALCLVVTGLFFATIVYLSV